MLRLQAGVFSLLLFALFGCGKGGGKPAAVAPNNPNPAGLSAHHQPVNVISKHCLGGGQISITGQARIASPSALQAPLPSQLKIGDSVVVSGSIPISCGNQPPTLVPFQCQGTVRMENNRAFACHSGYVGSSSTPATVPASTTVPSGAQLGAYPVGGALTGGMFMVYGNGQIVQIQELTFQSPFGSCREVNLIC